MRLLCALGLFLALLHVTSCAFRIGAFNIQCFGKSKSGIKDPTNKYDEARKTITKIVQRYDIILIQEVRCNKGLTVPDELMALVNQGKAIGSPDPFKMISSDPLGPSPSHKERYLFLYKDKTVTVTDKFQYDDTAHVFDRPPFIVKFSSTQTDVTDFVLIPIHAKPDNAVLELNALVDVVDAAKLKWKENNIMVLGDFNADGKYVNKKQWKDILLLFTNKGLHCLINKVDTTVATSSNTYDRIVVTTEMNNGVVPGSAGVYNFKAVVPPLSQDEAEKVSDHFPVEVELKEVPTAGGKRTANSVVAIPAKNTKLG